MEPRPARPHPLGRFHPHGWLVRGGRVPSVDGRGGPGEAMSATLAGVAGLAAVAVHDLLQRRHSILRNYPVLGHVRFLLEDLRPELQQYFIERNYDGRPYDRDTRTVDLRAGQGHPRRAGVRHRARRQRGRLRVRSCTRPRRWTRRSSRRACASAARTARSPYDMALLNVSAMSFGALVGQRDPRAQRGRGGRRLRPRHRRGRPDRLPPRGRRRPDLGDRQRLLRRAHQGRRLRPGRCSRDKAAHPQVKCVSLKLSQGAKPGIGGVLPGGEGDRGDRRGARRAAGREVRQPGRAQGLPHAARARRASSPGCASWPAASRPASSCASAPARELLAICKAMLEEGITPDFIVVDGSEGGTGAAPLEFEDHVGTPLTDGPDHGAQRARRHRAARPDPDRRERQGRDRHRHRQAHRAGRRLHQRGAGDDDGRRLHPGAAVPHQHVPGRRRDPGPEARPRARRARQDRARHAATRQATVAEAQQIMAVDGPRTARTS